MCGIVGILVRNGTVSPELLESATRSLTHRGPDDHGTVIVRETEPEPLELGLGNRRLAILDLSPLGHQPMQDPENGNWVVHNGEIYNFRELRSRLEAEGAQFTSHSDTEVILKAYARWGEECFPQFRGMFAFAIWDAQRRRLLIARDPMGIKPLYYHHADGHLLFASEIRTLLKTGLIPRKISSSALWNYLAFGSVYEPQTFIDGIAALPPGHYLRWEQGNLDVKRFWNLIPDQEFSAKEHQGSRISAENAIHETLDESVRMQLVSDVPVGVFLSGGIDSSTLVAILHRSGIRPSTFSIVFREQEYSEAEHSRAVAHAFQSDHHEITVSQHDVLDAIPQALSAMDQPTMDGINTYFVSQQARAAGVKVALSGLGGDELFAGYPSFRTVPRMERFKHSWSRLPHVLRGTTAAVFAALASPSDQNRKLSALLQANGQVIHPYFLSRMVFAPKQRKELSRAISKQARDRADEFLRGTLRETRSLDPVNRVSYLESRCYMLNTLLRDSDFMSMAHGLEVRVPLIDHQLARQVLALPGAWKVGGTTPKRILVEAAGALPHSIVHRHKRGFILPFQRWIHDALRPEVESALAKISDCAAGELLDSTAAQSVWGDFRSGKTSWSRPWSLFVLQRWCEKNLY